jgi:hypothetical protein
MRDKNRKQVFVLQNVLKDKNRDKNTKTCF